jgi:hypothetical protein
MVIRQTFPSVDQGLFTLARLLRRMAGANMKQRILPQIAKAEAPEFRFYSAHIYHRVPPIRSIENQK